jgi:hypothetical protein
MIKSTVHKLLIVTFGIVLIPALIHAAVMPVALPLGSFGNDLLGPTRITVNERGMVYVTDPLKHKVNIYSSNGQLVKKIKDVRIPLGIDCDSTGQVFIGDGGSHNIRVYSDTGEFRYAFGGIELGNPVDLEFGNNGLLYVVDSKNIAVHIYDVSGSQPENFYQGPFTSYLTKPVSIAVDVDASEIYVADKSGIIYIFDLDGNYLRMINGAGGWFSSGEIPSPQGMFIDADKLYVVEAYYGAVAVFSKIGAFLGYIGDFGGEEGLLRVPLDAELDKNNRMLVADYNNSRISVFGLDNYTDWEISPSEINLTVYENGNPVSQDISVSANVPSNFTVTSNQPWLAVSPLSGTTDAVVTMTVDPTGLTEDASGTITINSDNGTENIVKVDVSVVQDYSMIINHDCDDLTYQKGSLVMPTCTININNGGSNYSWNADTSDDWISMDATSGYTASESSITVTADAIGKGGGKHFGTVMIDAGAGVTGSPASVDVIVDVLKAGTITVNTNLNEASYTISGAASFSGSGVASTFDDAPHGMYGIVFDHVQGYSRPAPQSFSVQTGKETVIEGVYRDRKVANALVGISGGMRTNGVSIVDITSGLQTGSFNAVKDGADIAVGDFDGDGVDEIAISDLDQTLKIYEADGTFMGKVSIEEGLSRIASADINGNGMEEVLVGIGSGKRRMLRYVYFAGNVPVLGGKLLKEKSSGEFSIAAGDMNGDGVVEIAIADASSIDVYDISKKKAVKIGTITVQGNSVPIIAMGDLNDDGINEITVSELNGFNENVVRVLHMDGTAFLPDIVGPFSDLGYSGMSSLSTGDIDGDGMDEIVIGAPVGDEVRVYESDGSYSGRQYHMRTGSTGVKAMPGGF